MLDRAKVRETYLEAAGLPDAARAAFLDRACGDDPALRAEVESLLASAAGRPRFLESPTAASPRGPQEVTGTRIGPYRLLQEIGHGGFGSVYMAEQMEPVRRRVALKIIKLGMDTRAVIARFEAERQALAMMDHVNIARVFDAGATESGRPYFVMELVRGEAITAYCDNNSLSIPERLGLFLQVCHAVQHAHSKGVIHRDIKPSNILVATEDGRPHAKVIDFGIAKATERPLTDKTLFTDFRQFIGTPEYMSPEQTEGSLNVDTRSDVYSLGVLLYELLTGATPFDPKTLRAAAYAEIQRIIREVDPPKPSTRLSTSVSRGEVATHRRTNPQHLSALIKGDLDWIVMRALDKERARRYDTASELAADIERHLAGDPVLAAPPSAPYRARKFVRRNRTLVLAGAAVVAALILGVIGTTIGLVRASSARDEEQAHRQAAQESAQRAEAEAERAGRAEAAAKARAAELELVAAFQEGQLAGADPQAMGVQLRADLLTKAREVARRSGLGSDEVDARIGELDRLIAGADFTGISLQTLEQNVFRPAQAEIERRFGNQPLVKARLLQAVADVMRELGLQAAARSPQKKALAIRQSELGSDHPSTLISINNAGCLALRNGDLDDAETLLREVVAARRRLFGEDDPDTLVSMVNLGTLLAARGKLDDAQTIFRTALEKRRRALGDEDPQTLSSINNLGMHLFARGQYADAVALLREAAEKRRRIFGVEHRETLTSMGSLATALQAQHEFSEAEPLHREVLEHRRRLLGDDHPHTLVAINSMGLLLHEMGNRTEAARYYREALEGKRRVLGPRHTQTLMGMSNLAFLLMQDGNVAEAEGLFREAVEGFGAVAGDENMPFLFARIGLAGLLTKTARAPEAVAILTPVEPAARRVFVKDKTFRLGEFLGTLGRARVAAGQLDAAEPSLMEAYAILRETRPGPVKPLESLVDLFEARHREKPDGGFDKTRDEWRAKLEAATPAPQAR